MMVLRLLLHLALLRLGTTQPSVQGHHFHRPVLGKWKALVGSELWDLGLRASR